MATPQEPDRVDLLTEPREKESQEGMLDSSSPSPKDVRTCEDTIRALKTFRRSLRMSIAQHQLAKDYFSSRYFYFFTLPIAFYALESSVFSFSTYYMADDVKDYATLCVLAMVTAVFSMGIIILQTISRQCQYKERSVMHDATADNLKGLELELDEVLGDVVDEKTDWMVRSVFVKQFKNVLKGCKSEIPLCIRNAYRLLERDMESLYRHCHGNSTTSSSSSSSFDDFHKMAFEILNQEIRMHRSFTCSLPHPGRVKQKTISILFQNERELEAEAMLWEKEQRRHKEEEKILLRQLEEAEANGRIKEHVLWKDQRTKMEHSNYNRDGKDEPKRQHEEEVIFYKEEETTGAKTDSPV